MPRATYYRRRRPQNATPRRRPSPRALSDAEPTAVLAVLHEPQFVDLAPHRAAPQLLARRPNQLWSWDITELWGPAK
jgi:putative transposase